MLSSVSGIGRGYIVNFAIYTKANEIQTERPRPNCKACLKSIDKTEFLRMCRVCGSAYCDDCGNYSSDHDAVRVGMDKNLNKTRSGPKIPAADQLEGGIFWVNRPL